MKIKRTKSKISTAKQPSIKSVDDAIKIMAYSSLKTKELKHSYEDVEIEAYKMERCIEDYYRKEKHEMQYLEFASSFIMANFKEFVFGTKFKFEFVPEPDTNDYQSTDLSNYEYPVLFGN